MILHIYIFKTPASSFSKFFYCFLVSNFFLLWYFKFMPSHIGLSLFFIFYFLKVSILVIYLRFLFFLSCKIRPLTFDLLITWLSKCYYLMGHFWFEFWLRKEEHMGQVFFEYIDQFHVLQACGMYLQSMNISTVIL